MPYSELEKMMWSKPIREITPKLSDEEINEKYRAGEERIVTETNREKIPNFVEALKKKEYMQVRPFYQRRDRWNTERQSKLIESFIMNIPVPPLFLYEKDFNQYEVMDGQQRITALKSFYAGEFKLQGLEIWRELNGRTYSTLPSQVRQGLDRRSISYIVVLKESTQDEEDAVQLRQTVFQRLNTGGVKLESQEIRNCLFQGPFNNMLIDLTRLAPFRDAFGLPRYSLDENEPNAAIKANTMYQKFDDAELVLRFFALRHAAQYTKGMHGFLDLYMNRARNFTQIDIEFLHHLFEETISLAREIYGDFVFRPYDKDEGRWVKQPQKAFYDCVMVGISENLDAREILLQRKDKIIDATRQLFLDNPDGTFTGRGNTKEDIEDRIELYSTMLAKIIS